MLLELEIRVALAALSGRTLVSYNNYPISHQPDDHLCGRFRASALLDLFDVPVKHASITAMYKRGFRTRYDLPWRAMGISHAYFRCPGMQNCEDAVLQDFKCGRNIELAFPDNDDDAWLALTLGRTFSTYSYFFLASQKEKKLIRNTVAGIVPKPHLLEIAKKIVRDIGTYSAIHLRLGDFVDWWVKTPQPKQVLDHIVEILPPDLPLVVCTDSSDNLDYMAPIQNAFKEVILIDQLIVNDYKSLLSDVPKMDASVIALLTMLVAQKAEVFLGSVFSTFTAHIQRRRIISGMDDEFRYLFNPFDSTKVPMKNGVFIPTREGHFSWNRFDYELPANADANAWFREWPEAIN